MAAPNTEEQWNWRIRCCLTLLSKTRQRSSVRRVAASSPSFEKLTTMATLAVPSGAEAANEDGAFLPAVDDADLMSAADDLCEWAKEPERAASLRRMRADRPRPSDPLWHLAEAWGEAQRLLEVDPPSRGHAAFARSVLTALCLITYSECSAPLRIALDQGTRALLDRWWRAQIAPRRLRRAANDGRQLPLFPLAA
jgi:hypothetical protein